MQVRKYETALSPYERYDLEKELVGVLQELRHCAADKPLAVGDKALEVALQEERFWQRYYEIRRLLGRR
jgi:hypothetical protein